MADTKKTAPQAEEAKKKNVEVVTPAQAGAPAVDVTPARAGAPAVDKATPAKAGAPAVVKPVAKKAAPPAKKAEAKPAAKAEAPAPEAKPATKPSPKKKKEVVEQLDRTDIVKKALWEALSKSKAKKLKGYNAIQVYAEGLDSFFIAIHEGEPAIERHFYQGHSGDLQASETALLKIAAGNYDFIKAVKAEEINFSGRLSVLLKILDLF
ncbi:MAG: hypothetical protein FWG83_00955 [Oscillospiraceae bacterium]|nr:hypothetical protein [Oscillospiraceae bacterium]